MRIFIVLLASLLLLASNAGAAEVSGVSVPESDASAGGGAPLVLNGAGVRRRAIFKVYVIGLYLPKKTKDAAEAVSGPGPKRAAIQMLREVGAQQFVEALQEGLRDNHTPVELKALEGRMNELAAIMETLKEAKEGMRIALDWVPGTGTLISIDGTARGKPLPGDDLYRALLRIWLGDKPVQSDLKSALLGGP